MHLNKVQICMGGLAKLWRELIGGKMVLGIHSVEVAVEFVVLGPMGVALVVDGVHDSL